MKLGALGVATLVIGAVLGEPGLVVIGAFWVLMGFVVRQHALRLKALQTTAGKPTMDGRTFAINTLLWAVLGVPSLLVGLLELGISAEHADWRWLPIGIGAFAVAIGGIGGILYLTGSTIEAVVESGPEKKTPATLWIRAMRETGTFVNERPRIELDLTVEPDAGTGLASYEVTKKATVPFTALGALRVGDGFQALVAGPEEPTAMDIAWDKPVRGPAS